MVEAVVGDDDLGALGHGGFSGENAIGVADGNNFRKAVFMSMASSLSSLRGHRGAADTTAIFAGAEAIAEVDDHGRFAGAGGCCHADDGHVDASNAFEAGVVEPVAEGGEGPENPGEYAQ